MKAPKRKAAQQRRMKTRKQVKRANEAYWKRATK